MNYTDLANLLTGLALLLSSIGPLVFIRKVKIPRLRNLTYLLCAFLILHAIYHLTYYFDSYWLSAEIFGPVSVFSVIVFALYLYRTTFPQFSSTRRQSATPLAAGASLGAFLIPTIGPNISAAMLFISFAIFVLMFAKYPSIKSLHFQFTVFLSIWALSEAIFSLQQSGMNLSFLGGGTAGIWAHFVSMAALGVFVNYRFFGIWRGVKRIAFTQKSLTT